MLQSELDRPNVEKIQNSKYYAIEY
jgi:hypothetical protein